MVEAKNNVREFEAGSSITLADLEAKLEPILADLDELGRKIGNTKAQVVKDKDRRLAVMVDALKVRAALAEAPPDVRQKYAERIPEARKGTSVSTRIISWRVKSLSKSLATQYGKAVERAAAEKLSERQFVYAVNEAGGYKQYGSGVEQKRPPKLKLPSWDRITAATVEELRPCASSLISELVKRGESAWLRSLLDAEELQAVGPVETVRAVQSAAPEHVEKTELDASERLLNDKIGSFSSKDEQRARAEEAKPFVQPAREPEPEPPATTEEELPEPVAEPGIVEPDAKPAKRSEEELAAEWRAETRRRIVERAVVMSTT